VFSSISLTLPWIFHITGTFFYQPSYKYNVHIASFYACALRTVTGIAIAVKIIGFGLGYGRKYYFKHCPL
jgi:hypothetical protein